ncbi:putative FBD-associated F-box protein At5g56690 [Papaver somniferum]|uniref:putative FBD-associated F-box protein At5g56690 n=1 Tax=Papaver somniferum TaxID=3469 RepID=UPI000E6F4D16|nr:putative FBD-associated F-box protein At5g56690 [Papaver somniferum]
MDESSSSQSIMEDRISDLPDSLIHMILSFIDIKYAVQTSVLSKRWQYIWRSLTMLNLDVSQLSGRSRTGAFTKFISFVYKVFLFRDDHRIQRFQLNFRQDSIDSSHIDTWIDKAVKHNVEELCIKNETMDEFSIFSHSLCTCKSLTKLELELSFGFIFGSEIASTPVILPKLKSMNLQFRYLSPDNVKLANVLFTKCPALESLVLDIRICRTTNLRISVPTLKHFSLSLTSGSYLGPNKVTLCAPNLSSFICFSNLLDDYCLESLSSLVTADVRINIGQDDKVNKTEIREAKKVSYAQSIMKLMIRLHKEKVLSLTNDFKVWQPLLLI